MAINTRRKRPAPPIARKRAKRPARPAESVPRDMTPDVRTFYRDPDWKGWSFEPPIEFVKPVDVLKLIGRRDDDDGAGN